MEAVTVLGRNLLLLYGPTLAGPDRARAGYKITAAIDLIHKHEAELSAEEVLAISQIQSFFVAGSDAYIGQTSSHGMTLSLAYIDASSPSWIASLIGHEGQHALNGSKFKGDSRWKDEQAAGTLQLGLGKKLGFSPGEISYLAHWIDDSNHVAMQQHMDGFKF